MKKYHGYSLKLTDEENEKLKLTGVGVKKIFMTMVNAIVNKKTLSTVEHGRSFPTVETLPAVELTSKNDPTEEE